MGMSHFRDRPLQKCLKKFEGLLDQLEYVMSSPLTGAVSREETSLRLQTYSCQFRGRLA